MIPERLIFVDLETTGTSARHHRIIEVGLCETVRGKIVSEWSALIDPETPLPPFIQLLTGISDAMVQRAPTFVELAGQLLEQFNDAILVAHNARFDGGFLRTEFERVGIEFDARMLCTVKLSRKLFPQHKRHNLESIIERHGLSRPADRHRALADARLTAMFYCQLLENLPEDAMAEAIGEQLKRPSLPAHVPRERIEAIPRSPGVYLFYGENQTPLYIGKSVDLKSRVLSHFAQGNREPKGQRLSQKVHRVEWIETAGELGALLLESRLVKELLPVHNRRLRRTKDVVTIRLAADGTTSTVQVSPLRDLSGEDLMDVFGVFRTRRQADRTLRELAGKEGLCSKLMGLEKGAGACFNYQIKKCRGACVGKENPTLHRLRLMQALTMFKLESWPFAGAIGILETSRANEKTEIHVFNHWCHWGSVDNEADLWEILEKPEAGCFDLDSYKILSGFFKRSKNGAKVIPLQNSPQSRTESILETRGNSIQIKQV